MHGAITERPRWRKYWKCMEHDSRDEAQGSASVSRGKDARRDCRRYEHRDVRGRVLSGTRTESDSGDKAEEQFPVIPILKLNNIDFQWSFNDMVSATTATTKTA